MSGAAMAMPQDPKAAFKAEWEALQMHTHQFALRTTVDAAGLEQQQPANEPMIASAKTTGKEKKQQ